MNNVKQKKALNELRECVGLHPVDELVLMDEHYMMKNKMEKRNKVYLSGKITGLELGDAQKLFEDAEIEMQQYYDVVNPMKLRHDHDQTWESYMREDLTAMLQCQFICMLPNWEDSKGARIEKDLAESLRMPVIYLTR